MTYVYIIRSISHPNQRYFGIASDLSERLREHNLGRSLHTSNFKPWKIETYLAFSDKRKAIAFERYLKTGAGWAFSLKRL